MMDIDKPVAELVARFPDVLAERMQGWPILNPAPDVVAVDLREFS